MAVKPQDSLAFRVRSFFKTNPDEELTYEDLMDKFDCTDAQAYDVVRRLKRTEVVSSTYVIRSAKGAK